MRLGEGAQNREVASLVPCWRLCQARSPKLSSDALENSRKAACTQLGRMLYAFLPAKTSSSNICSRQGEKLEKEHKEQSNQEFGDLASTRLSSQCMKQLDEAKEL